MRLTPPRGIVTDDGTALPYGRGVLATGSRARRPSALPGELTPRALDDALRLRDRLLSRPSVVVVGGGPLGQEIASGCPAAGFPVVLVPQGPPLGDRLGAHLSRFAEAAREHGVGLGECGSARLEKGAGCSRGVLGDGRVPEAPKHVTAVGDVPDTARLAGTGLVAAGGAVPVDARGLAGPDTAALPAPHGPGRVPLWSSGDRAGRGPPPGRWCATARSRRRGSHRTSGPGSSG
ncbi:FAD-dependent oxidoreductase [Streptomyces sp. AD55]|uniref:FAD-dependent oxidoreductase n=1 Tax=Streptomyces sp. AD55 TaxID=3242895 RepID=UPI0035280120